MSYTDELMSLATYLRVLFRAESGLCLLASGVRMGVARPWPDWIVGHVRFGSCFGLGVCGGMSY
jgi:hypothetical protein